MNDTLELPFADAVRLKPQAIYVLACVVRFVDEQHRPAICSDVVSLMAWQYGQHPEHGTCSKRLSELRDAGFIEAAGKRQSELTHQAQTEWLPTAAGRLWLAQRAERAA